LLFSYLYASLQKELSRLRGPCDYSVAFKKKSSLPAHIGIRAAGELDFFDYFSNLYHAYAPDNGSNAGSYARMCRFWHSRAYAKTNAELCIQALS
jgi:hypothetical protein